MQGIYSYVPETNRVSRLHLQCCSFPVFAVCVTGNVVIAVGQAVGQFQSHYTFVVLIYQLISNVYNSNAAHLA